MHTPTVRTTHDLDSITAFASINVESVGDSCFKGSASGQEYSGFYKTLQSAKTKRALHASNGTESPKFFDHYGELMKKLVFLLTVFCLSSMAAFAQDKTGDFSGTWTLDVRKSKLDERARIESMKMTVSQTAKDITVATETKRQAPPEGATGRPAGGMGRGGMGGGDNTFTYTLDGKETTAEVSGPMGAMPVILKAVNESGKLTLSSSRTFSGPMGEITATTKEVWSLSTDGKSLTVEREQQSPRGTNASTMVFTKQ